MARRRLPLAAAVLRLAAARRRLRHQRLLRGAARVRHPARVHRARRRQAHARGIRVITDLVVNHTSDQHPWFQASRATRRAVRRLLRVDRRRQQYTDARIIFVDTETSNWTFDPVRRQYFWHRFFSHQPDLNFDNPAVVDAISTSSGSGWTSGIDGFRLDAIPYLFEREGTNCENLPETHDFLSGCARLVDEEYPGRILLAEANQWPEGRRRVLRHRDASPSATWASTSR